MPARLAISSYGLEGSEVSSSGSVSNSDNVSACCVSGVSHS